MDSFVRSFGAKAFRRPLLESEVARYSKLFAKQATTSNNFVAGAQLIVEAMLQSPNFLLRTENGAEPKWRSYETASRLSYFLWNSMPDDKLIRAAKSGELSTPEGVERQTRRLLGDAKARESMNEFVEQWLRFDRLLNSVKDRRTFPQYTPELALAMTQEPLHLASNLIWNNGNFMEFFSADYAYLNSSLAALYKVQAPKTEFEKYRYRLRRSAQESSARLYFWRSPASRQTHRPQRADSLCVSNSFVRKSHNRRPV